ncbi:hypothetical protein C8J57DRAFT_1452635 [Mycena rebaudengoi]|nr:hypothetical protein C8J57DRAFT_1452635 [Mycena rebaudengoi]
MFAKSAIITTLATLTLCGIIKRDDSYQQVIIPQGETFDQFTLSWKAECDKLFFASEGGVYTNATFVEPASIPADALVYCGWYTERPTVVYDNTVECANGLGVQFA